MQLPALLRTIVASVPAPLHRVRAKDGSFSLTEHAWHLADIEIEGYGVRIERILNEVHPSLPNFFGDVVAAERRYNELDVETALARFEHARATNLARLESAADDDWQRTGEQQGVGVVTLARVFDMMRGHDASHGSEIAALLRELGVAVPEELQGEILRKSA